MQAISPASDKTVWGFFLKNKGKFDRIEAEVGLIL
jgi:hypothetical protein